MEKCETREPLSSYDKAADKSQCFIRDIIEIRFYGENLPLSLVAAHIIPTTKHTAITAATFIVEKFFSRKEFRL